MHTPGDPESSLTLLFLAIVLQFVSGMPLLLFRGSTAAHRCSTLLMLLASLIGSGVAIDSLIFPHPQQILLDWGLPFGPAEVALDPLSAFFLLPVFLITGCSALYGLGYWPARRHPRNAGRLTLFLGMLAGALTLLLLARHMVLFLMAWEIMAFGSFFALTVEDERVEVRSAGILYLITTHLGTLALLAMFSLIRGHTGSLAFPDAGTLAGSSATAATIFLAALLGFGVKAGIMPLHVWLPSAHANAPSHISALMSGVVLKMGVYGLLRVCFMFTGIPAWWGASLLVLGIVSAVLGVAFALGQHDFKKLLAYHSIENIGIILMGLGLAMLGLWAGQPPLALLGLAGALLHVLNHAIFKALLFLGAGAVIHASGTRTLDLLGGAARRLPWTAAFFLIGSVAICGLPPLNGFISELLIYLGCFTAASSSSGLGAVLPALTAPALALVGALALACFVKVYGVVFLGLPRQTEHAGGGEAPPSMLVPMALLSGLCLLIGLFPWLVAPLLENVARAWLPPAGTLQLGQLVPLGWLTVLNLALLCCAAAGALLLYRRSRGTVSSGAPTWGCGYLSPSPRMQYSAASFAEMLVGYFRGVLRPSHHQPDIRGPFPAPSRFDCHTPETVLEYLYLPLLEFLHRKTVPLRRLQHGQLHLYICYILVTLVVLLLVTVP